MNYSVQLRKKYHKSKVSYFELCIHRSDVLDNEEFIELIRNVESTPIVELYPRDIRNTASHSVWDSVFPNLHFVS